ncbi:putative pectinesterase 63 [Hibiscus syriacus]|uniref:putative pectinesterase 63 n=1 Tax=Hibiscus syriacus TaxID=106335 RepID=UPI0019228090|nr:putative pectinesterase 63 [Hibiscus syriacus]
MKELQELQSNDIAHALFNDFDNVTAAVDSIPLWNMQRVVIWIGGGYYFKITINRTKNFVTFFGDPLDMPKIEFNGTAVEFVTLNSATVVVDSDYFVAVNIAFMNSAPMSDGQKVLVQAVAIRISGNKEPSITASSIGFQDTLYDDRGMYFFKDYYIEGTIDFIFGNGKSLYLHKQEKRLKITVDLHSFTTTLLVRATPQRTSVVHGSKGRESSLLSFTWATSTVYYGEYKCMGSGASSTGRIGFARILSEFEARPFLSLTYINGSNWLLPPPSM